MADNYTLLVKENLKKLYSNIPVNLYKNIIAVQSGDRFAFRAFGEDCIIEPEQITLGNGGYSSVLGILISLYALSAISDAPEWFPFNSFKETPNSMPYIGAFKTHTEDILIPHVREIEKQMSRIIEAFDGMPMADSEGDFSFILKPLPKIGLRYVCYHADDEFPASVTCLYSHNAHLFLPVDALADVGEYTSKKIIALLNAEK